MRWRLRLGLAILAASSSITFPPAIRPQCPSGSGDGSINQRAHTPLPDEVKLRQDETEGGALPRKVHVEDVTIDGAPDLEESIRARIHEWLPKNGYESDSDWIDWIAENAEEVLRDNGYFDAKVNTQARVLSSDTAEEWVSVYCHVREGPQYRLADIQFTGVHVFPPSQLRSWVPLSDGELFDISKLRKGLEAFSRMYGTRGYINFTASPNITTSDDRQYISVVVNVVEGRQFTVGSVQVFGLDHLISGHDIKLKLKHGDVFNPNFIDDFFQDNQLLLPAGVSPRENVEIKQRLRDATVAIVFDLRPCPRPSSQ